MLKLKVFIVSFTKIGMSNFNSNVYQYFDYPNFGICKRIVHGSGHWMMASTFFHRTSVCVIHWNDSLFWKYHDKAPDFNLFAWGEQKVERRARRLMQNIETERVVDEIENVAVNDIGAKRLMCNIENERMIDDLEIIPIQKEGSRRGHPENVNCLDIVNAHEFCDMDSD